MVEAAASVKAMKARCVPPNGEGGEPPRERPSRRGRPEQSSHGSDQQRDAFMGLRARASLARSYSTRCTSKGDQDAISGLSSLSIRGEEGQVLRDVTHCL